MSQWILSTHNEAADYRLFCFPHAGSGAIKYLKWAKYFDSRVEICPVMLPGREYRLNEPLIKDYKVMVEAIFDGIKDKLQEKSYSLFGHSMGSILAYELTKRIEKAGLRKPDVVFLSGSTLLNRISSLDWGVVGDDEIAKYLVSTGGTPKELVEKASMRELYFPILRSDHQLVTSYHYSPEKLQDGTPIRAFAAKDDEIVNVKFTENIEELTDDFRIDYFTGGHFFVETSEKELCTMINDELIKYIG